MPILAYCLMSNHVHLLTKPTKNESLYKMMQGITLCYTQYINRTYKRTGRLWDYIELMKASIKEEDINNIRNHTRSGRPIGSESFIKKMARKLDRIFKLRSRGRPKKGER